MRWYGNVKSMGGKRNVQRVLMRKPEGKRPLERRRYRDENIKIDFYRNITGFMACYALYDHKTNDYIRRELRITGILDKIDEYRRNWFQHLQRTP